jgi:hypothetical protein
MDTVRDQERSEMLNNVAENGWQFMEDSTSHAEATDVFDDATDEWGPTEEIFLRSKSPVGLFFFFFPKTFWREVARQSTDYELQSRPERLFRHERNYSPDQHAKFRKEAKKFQEIQPKEVVHFIAMLLYRCINPMRSSLKDHWKKPDLCQGLEAPGTFGRLMSRNRFMDICRYVSLCSIFDTAWHH